MNTGKHHCVGFTLSTNVPGKEFTFFNWGFNWAFKYFDEGPVTLGSDYRTILKSDPILLILKSELDIPILKIDKFAVTLLRFIAADFFIARKMRQWFVLR